MSWMRFRLFLGQCVGLNRILTILDEIQIIFGGQCVGLNRILTILDEIQIIFRTVCGVISCPGRDSDYFLEKVWG